MPAQSRQSSCRYRDRYLTNYEGSQHLHCRSWRRHLHDSKALAYNCPTMPAICRHSHHHIKPRGQRANRNGHSPGIRIAQTKLRTIALSLPLLPKSSHRCGTCVTVLPRLANPIATFCRDVACLNTFWPPHLYAPNRSSSSCWPKECA